MVTKRLYGKEREWSIGQIKTCRKKQHVKIDDMKEMSDLFCSKAAVGGNYNLTRDSNRRDFNDHEYDSGHQLHINKETKYYRDGSFIGPKRRNFKILFEI